MSLVTWLVILQLVFYFTTSIHNWDCNRQLQELDNFDNRLLVETSEEYIIDVIDLKNKVIESKIDISTEYTILDKEYDYDKIDNEASV